MTRKDEILVIVIIEKGEQRLESVIHPFLDDHKGLNLFIIDNDSCHDDLEGLAQYPFIRIHKRPVAINRAMAYNIALEIALSEGYKGVFLWDSSTSLLPNEVRRLSDWVHQEDAIDIAFQYTEFINLYIPRDSLLEIGLFYPLIHDLKIKEEILYRVQSKGLKVGCFASRSIVDPSSHFSKRIYKSGIGPDFSNLKKSSRYWWNRPKTDLIGLARSLQRKNYAPVLLLVYNRPEHTKRLLHDFWMQPEAPQTPLYILSDGGNGIDEVREICSKVAAENSNVTLWCQNENQGLAKNVIAGVNRVLECHDSLIVLEDDLRLSPYFLRWMNDSLERYKDEKQIAHLHAGTFYTSPKLHNNHALLFAGSWGWATWKDRWNQLWEPDGEKLLRQLLNNPALNKHFNYGGYMNFTRMLCRQISGQNNSWAIRWHASLLLNHKISINSNPPLVSNDGFDGTGVHSSGDDRYNTGICPYPLYALNIDEIPVQEEPKARKILLSYYKRTNNKMSKAWYKLKEIINRSKR